MKKLFNWGINFIKDLDWTEVFRYLIIGLCSTGLNIFIFWILGSRLGLSELIANIVAWIIATLFAFITNSFYVFRVKPDNIKDFLKYMAAFFGERVFTLGVEEMILFVFVTRMSFERMPVKAVATVITIALNYLISKLIVFRKKASSEGKETGND